MSTRIAIVVNECSGKQSIDLAEVQRLLTTEGIEADTVCLEGAAMADGAAELVQQGYEMIVAAGGDGTISTIASVLAGTPVVLGVLPSGSLNHFAKDVGIPLELGQAIANLRDGRPAAIDVGEVNGHSFINNISLGMYPAFVEARGDVRRKPLLARWSTMLLAAITVLRRLPLLRARVTVDGRPMKRFTPVVFIGNNQYELDGPALGSRPALDRGRLSVLITRSRGPWGLVKLVLRAGVGTLRGAKDLDELLGREVEVRTKYSRPAVAVDGEVLESIDWPLRCRVRPGALRVQVPAARAATIRP